MRRIFAAIPLNRSPYNGSLPSLILEKLKSILGDAGKGLYEKFIKSPVDVYDINDKTPAIKNTWNNAGVAANGFGHNMYVRCVVLKESTRTINWLCSREKTDVLFADIKVWSV